MKTTGFAIAAATLMMIMGCSQKKAENSAAFIGPSDIQVVEGAMTPETLLSFGRLSDPQLSPDGKWILYGVSYTSIRRTALAGIFSSRKSAGMRMEALCSGIRFS